MAAAEIESIAKCLGIPVAGDCLVTTPERFLETAACLKDPAGADFDYLDMITAVDYPDRFELVYRFRSLKNNRTAIVKARLNRENPSIASLTGLWKGADFQEREIFDLFGITFTGHPCLRRIMLWEGFKGYPLRKDFSRGT